MGKQGPCNHCGITSTPLWRNGPPEKPILCNACGSRWRTKGTLTNYTPLHARENVDQIRPPKVKTVDQGLQKRKNTEFLSLQGQRESETVEEDTSNRSSSGSAISYSESCSHFGSEAAGAVQSTIWDAPSRKRTCVGRPKPSSVEKLTMDLHSILHQQPSYISTSPEDDLLYDAETQFGSVEISNGGVLLRHPNVQTLDEESEASSLPVDTKLSVASESYSRVSSLPVNSVDKIKRSFPAEEHASRDKASLERLYLLRSKDSPLANVDLKEVVNPEVFVKHLTLEEQQQLMKYLPSIDAARTSETLADMFHSPQFAENLSYFRRLLLEGTFDMSSSGATADECRTLKKLVLGSSAKSKWVEYHTRIKNSRSDEDKGRKGVRTGTDHPGKKTSIKSPKRSNKPKVASLISLKSPRPDSSLSFSPRGGTFGSYDEEEEGLLLDLRPNGSFPEAELLSETWKQTSTSSSTSHPLKHWGS